MYDNHELMKNQDVICIAPDFWNSPLRRRQQVMLRLSKANRIFFISVLAKRWRDSFDVRLEWLLSFPPEINCKKQNLYEFPLFNILPVRLGRYSFIGWINHLFIKSAFNRLVDQFNISNPILWYTFPTLPKLIDYINPKVIVYDCSDYWSDIHWRDEKILLECVDVVFATSQALYESKSEFNENIHLIPNAVDVKNYSRALLSETTIPLDVVDLQKPIVGFIGAINDKVDISLLENLARAHPEWTIVLVGPVTSRLISLKSLETLSNVKVLGYRKPDELPNYLKSFDVALIPYVLSDRTKAINPLKLYEYMAAGRPIVATPLPELFEFLKYVRIAHTEEEFISEIEEVLKQYNPIKKQDESLEFVKKHDWEYRVNLMSNLVVAEF